MDGVGRLEWYEEMGWNEREEKRGEEDGGSGA